MVQGCLKGLKIKCDGDTFTALQEHLEIVTEPVSTGEEFTEAVRHLIGAHKPDLVWLDPLLSFIGDDISKQDVCSYFLRSLLNPIAFEAGVTWMMMHHTAKPNADPKSKSHWVATDQSYAGTGSAELTNWARAVCLLRTTKDEGRFQLIMAKRGKRAGATNLEGDRTSVLHLKHSDDSILWEQTPEPVVKEKKSKADATEARKNNAKKEIKDLDGLMEKIVVPMKKTQIYELAESGGHGSKYLFRKNWDQLEKRLSKTSKGLFYNPDKYDEKTA